MKGLLQVAPGAFNQLVQGRRGYFLYNVNDAYVGRSLERYGEYSELEIAPLEQLCPPDGIFFDIGANIGTHTVAFSKAAGPGGFVYAFELQRIIFQVLCANVALNSLTNVDCRNAAMGEHDGFTLVPDITYDRAGNFGAVRVGQFESGRKVPVLRLDDFVDDVDRATLVKIDVEGMEEAVVRGGARFIEKFQPILYVENDRVERSESLIRTLLEMKYQLFWHLPPLYNPNNVESEQENVFGGIVSINLLCFPQGASVQTDLRPVSGPETHPLTTGV